MLTVSQPDFLTAAATETMTSTVLFVMLVMFSSLTALVEEFIWLCDILCSPYRLPTNNFISCKLFAALASAATKLHASVIAQAMGMGGGKRFTGSAGSMADQSQSPSKLSDKE